MEDREYCWPDWVGTEKILLDDVSRFNRTAVHSLHQVRTVADVQRALDLARRTNRPISVRGTKHSMGGHTLNDDGIVIDMQYVNTVKFDPTTNLVTVGSGTLWEDVIRHLNQYGKSPRTLQSYCTFSVGGTLSVNAHGITSDYSMVECVDSFTLIKADGSVLTCREGRGDDEASVLFRHCIGGYGLFGVVFDVTMKVSGNKALSLEPLMGLKHTEFPFIYERVLEMDDVEIKLARIDVSSFQTIDLYIFRSVAPTETVSALEAKPRELSTIGQVLYKWFAPTMGEIRFNIERAMEAPLDWASSSIDRNSMLFESAIPLAHLYSPLLKVDDTFILQEYFVPRNAFSNFYEELKKIVVEQLNKEKSITLLNITIRFVQHDDRTALPYARSTRGMYAFVLYYRLRRSELGDSLLQKYHTMFADLAIEYDGTFYLPYRHHYSEQQLLTAYPGFEAFCKMKRAHDPTSMFSNKWWEKYATKSITEPHEPAHSPTTPAISVPNSSFQIKPCSHRRTDSFKRLLANPIHRKAFLEEFLVNVFNVASHRLVYKHMTAAAFDLRNGSDDEIYARLFEKLRESLGGAQLSGLWRSVMQISSQKKELQREVMSILARTGSIGKIHSYCSVGDHGKLVLGLRKSLGMKGPAWIVHDTCASPEDAPAVLERGALETSSVGKFVKIDYRKIRGEGKEMHAIPSHSCDLLTINQGLHHLVPEQIPDFLAAVHRVLRPGGLFIVREHDLDEQGALMPMLDCAHTVFNAVTGVSVLEEQHEIRAFRSIAEWKSIIESHGFMDSMVYELQPHDPTLDVMMCFYAVGQQDDCQSHGVVPTSVESAIESAPKDSTASFLDTMPSVVLQLIIDLLQSVSGGLQSLRKFAQTAVSAMASDIPGLNAAVLYAFDNFIDPILSMASRFEPLTTATQLQSHVGDSLIPPEIFLLLPIIRNRAAKGGVFESVIISIFDKISDSFKADIVPVLSERSLDVRAHMKTSTETMYKWLCQVIPVLSDFIKTIDQFGFPERIANILRTFVGNGGGKPITEWLIDHLDETGFSDFLSALKRIVDSASPVAPTLTLILQEGSPWNRVAIAVLGCPDVRLSPMQAMMAKVNGLGSLVDLYHRAQDLRKSVNASKQAKSQTSFEAKWLDEISPVQTVKIHELKDIPDVLSVIRATFVAKALTALVSDKTEDKTAEVSALLNHGGTLRLSQLQGGRTITRWGEQYWELQLRLIPKSHFNIKQARNLREHLLSTGKIDATHRADASKTWFKIAEWLQVELLQLLGDRMEVVPWYRFPFMGLIKVYFNVFAQVVKVVAEDQGWKAAVMCSGFLTDLVPGIVMSILFMQMNALAFPLKKIIGTEYDESAMVEEVVVMAPAAAEWVKLLPSIRHLNTIHSGLYSIKVPTFKPFSETLVQLAHTCPAATIVQISNQHVVQVRLKANAFPDAEAVCNAQPGVSVKFKFQLPVIGQTTEPVHLSLAVEVQSLLAFLRTISSYGSRLELVQIYDFY